MISITGYIFCRDTLALTDTDLVSFQMGLDSPEMPGWDGKNRPKGRSIWTEPTLHAS